MTTIKGRVNKKWTSTDKYRDSFDRIFGKGTETDDRNTECDPADTKDDQGSSDTK